MNSIQDPSKKTSINSLLNPEASSAAALNNQISNLAPSLAPAHGPQMDPYPGSFVNGASFHLRAADWSDKRKVENGTAATQRHYQQHAMDTPEVYAEGQPPRMNRPPDEVNNTFSSIGDGVWQPPMPYGAPVIAPLYSDERTAISGDYQTHGNYGTGYTDEAPSNDPQNGYLFQHANSRGTVHSEDSPFTPPPYYSSTSNGFNAANYPPPPSQQLPQGQSQKVPQARLLSAPAGKRRSESEEVQPKAKRAKTKATKTDGAPGPSKRGYNSKKRSEAAQIAAQNAQLMPTVSYTQVPSEKGKEKADERMRIVTSDGASQGAEALHPELQFARCMSNRYKSDQFPRCVSCTRRWAGDTCRFQGIRFFLKDMQRNIVGISFVESQKADSPTMDFPSKWNIDLQPSHTRRTKVTIARALLPTLRKEMEHLSMPEIIRRPRESEVRATCDTCMTSLFSSSWMCRLCGREACAECFAQVKELTVDRPGANQAEIAEIQAKREKHAHSNPFFLSCTRRNEHQAKDFSPMSRFCKKELREAIEEMEMLLKEEEKEQKNAVAQALPPATSHPSLPVLRDTNSSTDFARSSQMLADLDPFSTIRDKLPPHDLDQPYIPSNLSSRTTSIPTRTIHRFSDSVLTPEVFPEIWALGLPLVVTDVLSKFKIQWTPEYFIQKYGSQSCLIIECQTEVNKRVTVGEFFSWFGIYEGRENCWKLKDWPPSQDFQTAFPELYEDFSRAVPVPHYVRKDGVLNVGSHFPTNTVAPDLGPKMYNSMASSLSAGSKGSTRLHMDMADALNVMTYAAPCADGSLGYAVWDLFRAQDSEKIRSFIRVKFTPANALPNNTNTNSGSNANGGAGSANASANGQKGKTLSGRTNEWSGINDPIHGQQFYLDEELRAELYERTGVRSFRVYQRPGEAVFIPAGCAHQVANMSDCVKVAIDFVSPENIARCEMLTKEFREQNQRKVWKEDVLQLRTMMWFAWLSCCQQERGSNKEEQSRDGA